MSVHLVDSVALEGARVTKDGYLIANAKVSRTGIMLYGGAELGRPDLDVVRVYRDEGEVFSEKAMSSFCHRPVTVDHPPERVNATNWRKYAVGFTSGDVARDGDFLRLPLTLMDAEAIQAVRDGKSEISCGYTCDIDFTPGTTASGEPFDARQIAISGNHIAAVLRGRAGPECRIGDDARARTTDTPVTVKGERAVPDEIFKVVVVDGYSIPCTPQSAEAIAKLQRQISDAAAATDTAIARIADAEKAHRSAIEAKDGQLAALQVTHTKALEAKDGEIAGLKATHDQMIQAKDSEIATLRVQTSDDAVDARVAARAAMLVQAKRILGDSFDPSGKSDADIRKAAVVKHIGDRMPEIENRDEDFYRHVFDTLPVMAPVAGQAPAQPDRLRQVIASGAGSVAANDAANPPKLSAWERNRQRIENAHLHAGAKE